MTKLVLIGAECYVPVKILSIISKRPVHGSWKKFVPGK